MNLLGTQVISELLAYFVPKRFLNIPVVLTLERNKTSTGSIINSKPIRISNSPFFMQVERDENCTFLIH